MKIRKVLVTGASGKIGRSLVPALQRAGVAVRALEFKTPVSFPDVEIVRGTVCDPQGLRAAVSGVDAVIHLASSKEDRESFFDVSVRGTFEVLDACKQVGVDQVILAGGDAAVGILFNPHPYPIDEQEPLRAYPGYYAFSKVMEETMANQYRLQYGLPVTILRFSWIHGEDDILAHATLAEPQFGYPVWRELASSPEQRAALDSGRDAAACLRHPDGSSYKRHVVSIHDVVQAFERALGNPDALGETFNIAAPSAFRYEVLARYIGGKLGVPVVDFELAGCHDFAIDIGKARSVLGYQPQWDIFRMVDEAVEFRRSGKKRYESPYSG